MPPKRDGALVEKLLTKQCRCLGRNCFLQFQSRLEDVVQKRIEFSELDREKKDFWILLIPLGFLLFVFFQGVFDLFFHRLDSNF
jgi:hypothetical protein